MKIHDQFNRLVENADRNEENMQDVPEHGEVRVRHYLPIMVLSKEAARKEVSESVINAPRVILSLHLNNLVMTLVFRFPRRVLQLEE